MGIWRRASLVLLCVSIGNAANMGDFIYKILQ